MTEEQIQYSDYLNSINFEEETENEYLNRIKFKNKFKQDNKNL